MAAACGKLVAHDLPRDEPAYPSLHARRDRERDALPSSQSVRRSPSPSVFMKTNYTSAL
jgi:hypothetical protein